MRVRHLSKTCIALASALVLGQAAASLQAAEPAQPRPAGAPGTPPHAAGAPAGPQPPSTPPAGLLAPPAAGSNEQIFNSLKTVALFAMVSLVPVAVLMVTAFVRINIVLVLLRQALGSPQVPGNQVITALALLLTLLVMQPVGEQVYRLAVEPYVAGRVSAAEAWKSGSAPMKRFMIDQIYATRHERYLREIYDYAEPAGSNRVEPAVEDLEMRVVAPAFLLSELTTALVMGFVIYLPFLVIDLVVSTVLMVMGLFMLPPALVALPLKLILFVLADGWMLVSGVLLRSFVA